VANRKKRQSAFHRVALNGGDYLRGLCSYFTFRGYFVNYLHIRGGEVVSTYRGGDFGFRKMSVKF